MIQTVCARSVTGVIKLPEMAVDNVALDITDVALGQPLVLCLQLWGNDRRTPILGVTS